MYRKFVFPAIAVTAWAQQPSPKAAAAEAALRVRAQQFFQLQVEKKYRQAESMVAEEARDTYYTGAGQYNIPGFTIEKVELQGEDRATVTIHTRASLLIPGAGPVQFETSVDSHWKADKGVWYLDIPTHAPTPFGEMTAAGKTSPGAMPTPPGMPSGLPSSFDATSMEGYVKADRDAVTLSASGAAQTVTITNSLPGGVDLELAGAAIPGVHAALEKKHLEGGEKTIVRLEPAAKSADGSVAAGKSGTVQVRVSPLGTHIDIRVTVE